ncbi:MAG: DUF58 domain-containing protein [Bacteroidota bacterium]|nr:DUF58 domain-containing protein [Bacteroidota bacterium]
MTAAELLKKVRELEIKSKKLTNHLFTGEYHTAFKGQGMAFKEVKEYSAGDDIRFIDWNVSARMNGTYSKVFEEERELSVFILVDASASNLFGTHLQNKKELITEICAVLAFSALSNNDKTGLIFFTDTVEKYIPSSKGRDHVLYMVRELLTFEAKAKQTNIVKALQFLNNITRHKSIVFVLSDFADEGYHEALRVAAKKHDVIGIQVFDNNDFKLPDIGLIQVQDAETGKSVWLDSSDVTTKFYYQQQFAKIENDAKNVFRTAGADLLQIATGADYVKILQQFFIQRA